MRILALLLAIFTALALANGLFAADVVPLDIFLEQIIAADTLEDAENWSAIADEVFTLYEDESFTDYKSRTTREVRYTFLGDSVEQEVLSEKTKGEEEDFGGDKEKKDDDSEEHSESFSFDDDEMPFGEESEGLYDYTDLGIVKLYGSDYRAIEYRSKKRDDEHFDGTAWFDPQTAQIRRMKFSYAKPPRAIKHFVATLGFTYLDGYRLMESFDMDIRGRYLLVIKFNFSIRQKYRDFKIL